MFSEEKIFTDKELSYEQLNQMKEHAKKYDYVVDKKEFLKNITPYEQKLVLLETRNPYEVLSYLDELNFENSRLILNQLTPVEIRKIIDEFTSEEKKKFYANFSDLSLVNQFIIYDKNSKDHITDLKTERKVEIIKSTKEETKESAVKVYETVSEEEKSIVVDSITDSVTPTILNEVVSLEQIENTGTVELEETIQEEVQEEQIEEIQEEPIEEKTEETQKEEIPEEKTEEQLNELDNFIRNKMEFYIKTVPQFSSINFEEQNLYINLSPELKRIIEKDFDLFRQEKDKENLDLFLESKTNCEQELIEAVMSTRKKDSSPIEDEEKTTQKTL